MTDLATVPSNITVISQTFRRPEACRNLVASVQRYYPTLVPEFLLVNDDSEYDRGLSWGRNQLVERARTDYVLYLDDDFVFTEKTDLAKLADLMDRTGHDMIGFSCGASFRGSFRTEGDVVHMLPERNARGLYDYVPNVFIARRQSLLSCRWDESLKLGEHFAFFYEHHPRLKIEFVDDVAVSHEHFTYPEYKRYRDRALGYLREYMKRKGIRMRVHKSEVILAE